MGKAIQETLRGSLASALIVAHHEDTTPLSNTLGNEGFCVKVIRRSYSPAELVLPSAIRTLLNHSSAWQEVIRANEPMLIVEADFVPCRGLGSLPMPYSSRIKTPKIGFLYAAGPVVYHHDQWGGFYGHACATVAYIIEPATARLWLELLDEHKRERDLSLYYQWEVEMFVQLRRCKHVRLYLTSKSYGEHGGIANSEHARHGFRAWHQADALMAPLAFLPSYAGGHWHRYLACRLRSRLRYVYKFVRGKYFDTWLNFLTLRPDRGKKLQFAWRRAFA